MKFSIIKHFQQLLILLLALIVLSFPLSAQAASSSGIRQSGNDTQLAGKDLSGENLVGVEYSHTNLEKANLSNANLRGAVLSSSSLRETNFHGTDFTQGIAYIVDFTNANLSDAVLVEAIMLGSNFDKADITGADFSDAVLDGTQVKRLCDRASGINSKTGVSTRDSLRCK